MNKLNYITLLTGFFLICSSPLVADEYITLNAKVDYADIVLLNKKASDFGGDDYIDKSIEERKEIISNSKIQIKDEDILELKKGEAVELNIMTYVSYVPNTEYPKFTDEIGSHGWNYSGHYPEADGNYKLEVKLPGHEKWFKLNYDNTRNEWSGLGTINPKIVGPCTIKLTKFAWIGFYQTTNHRDYSSKQRYLTRHEGGNVWVTIKKLKSSTPSSATTAQSLVLPEGSGDLTIIMEGSNDLINWTREDLGKKPEANRKTFYRIRAVKE